MSDIIRKHWNGKTEEYYQSDIPVYKQIIENPVKAFPVAVYPLIVKFMGDLRGKKVCVPSSGDNCAAIGFHLLGAKVTSCDLAENQIKHAKAFADKMNWDGDLI